MICFISRVDSGLRMRADHSVFSIGSKTIMPGRSELAGILSTILRNENEFACPFLFEKPAKVSPGYRFNDKLILILLFTTRNICFPDMWVLPLYQGSRKSISPAGLSCQFHTLM